MHSMVFSPNPTLALSIIAVTVLGCAHPSGASQRGAEVKPVASEATVSPDPAHDSIMTQGRHWTLAFYAGDTQSMWDRMGGPLRKLNGDKAGLDAFREKVIAQLGRESAVVDERAEHSEAGASYRRVARFERAAMPFEVRLGFDADGVIQAFGIRPARGALSEAPTDKLGYVTRTSLRLPFDGAWTVAWGGRTVDQNQHAVTRDQRFAYDFLIMNGGTSHAGDGTHNADYFAYGRPVLAPAAGRVAVVVDGIAENIPGQMDADHAGGNYVVLDHGDGEFSFLAHLVPGSVTVREGDRIEAGHVLGRCGNSGNSSEPHLHYHLQDSPKFFAGDGLPAAWNDYVADGKPIARGEATRGQVIQSAPPHRRGEGS